ncbi:hypothetical protein Tco_1031948 [Tanacetum coccineum]|uniref:Uncharacterized protein n=1 Tax=Tanacetum coccineum TaxID=301880 RepID=A0ABQ5GAG5_9ASTR
MEALIEDENAMDKGVANTVKNHKRQHDDDDEDPSAGLNQGKNTKRRRTKDPESAKKPSITKETSKGKASSKSSKTSKSATAKEPVEEQFAEVVMEDTVNTAVEDVPWFNQMVSAVKDPLTFNDLMATLIDFSKRQLWYRSQINKFYKHNVYSTHKILSVVSMKVEKLHGYGHLDEIVVKRADRQLYKFKEGDFVDLHLNDIEDMFLLAVQHKLFHLNGSDIIDFIVALRMFTRSIIIKCQVKDLQFSNGTLKTVRDELHHRILDFCLGYNKEMSRRKWMAIDKRRSELMVELIDKQMRERRIIRNLERLVGARELEMDYKLMTHTVRISQKSQENNQKRANTDTRIRRVQKEAKDTKPKPNP